MRAILAGSIYSRTPLAMAEYVIDTIDELCVSSKTKFTLMVGADHKLRIHRTARMTDINPKQFVSTFTKATCPDDLAEDIEAARGDE